MPRVVDHDVRRAELVEALWRVIRRDGMQGTSVRTVAAEAGVSAGALRHYFPSQSELVEVAVRSMAEAVRARVAERLLTWPEEPGPPGSPERREAVLDLLEQVLPLDARRRSEFEVWLELVVLARTSPKLRALAVGAHRGLRSMCAQAVGGLTGDPRDRHLPRDPALVRQVDQLHGLVDGLSLHLALYPRETSPARVREALREQLDTVARQNAC